MPAREVMSRANILEIVQNVIHNRVTELKPGDVLIVNIPSRMRKVKVFLFLMPLSIYF